MFWVLTWASLLLLVLYSPFGSPDLYSSKTYFKPQPSVDFKGIDIAKTSQPSKSKINNATYQESSMPDFNLELKKGITSNVVSGTSSGQDGNFPGVAGLNANSKESSNGGNNFSGGFLSNTSTKGKNNSAQTPGALSLSSDLSLVADNNTTTSQAANTGLTGTTDPGGDPTGDPIPVGDGWIILMVLISVYTLYKIRIIRR